MSNNDTYTKNDDSVTSELAPFEVREIEDYAKSLKIDYLDLPTSIREIIDAAAMNLVDAYGGKIMIIGYESVGKSFLIEQLAYNKEHLLKKINHPNITFVSINESDLYSIRDNFEDWRDYIHYVERVKKVDEENICFVTTSARVAEELFETSSNSKIILESNINTMTRIIESENQGEVNIWSSWTIFDANLVFLKKQELITSINNGILPVINSVYNNKLDDKKVTTFINALLREMPHDLDDNKQICIPAGVFARSVRILAGYLSLGSTPDLLGANGKPTFKKSVNKTIDKCFELFENFIGINSLPNFNPNEMLSSEYSEDPMDALPPGIPEGANVIRITQDDLKELIEMKKRRSGGEGSSKGAESKAVFSDPSTLADRIKAEVIGQDEAIKEAITNLIVPAAGLNDPTKPLSTMLLLGPTGVGKTKFAQTVAKELMTEPMNFIRLDMSEYSEKHTVNKLFGAPSGYVGHEEGGYLTREIIKNPNSVILLDEVEKAHPLVWDSFLQVFDAGRMTSGKGEVADFTKSLIFMTSNLGVQEVNKVSSGFAKGVSGPKNYRASKNLVMKKVEDFFRPELLNRIDSIVMLDSISLENAKIILHKEIEIIFNRARLAGFELKTPSDDIITMLLEKADINKYGAREIQRIVKNNLSILLATAILDQERQSPVIELVLKDDSIAIKN